MKFILLGAIAVVSFWTIFTWLAVRNIEEPKYTVLEKKNGYELRQYEPYLVAETTVTGDYRQGLNNGFRAIADYIFGNNTKSESIAMTAPVLNGPTSEKIAMTVPVLDENSGDSRVIAFVMPSKYTLDSIPKPNTNAVTLREVPSRTVAVLRFTWYATQQRVDNKKAELLQLLAAGNIDTLSEPSVAQYNPPLSMPLLLRNEILVEVAR